MLGHRPSSVALALTLLLAGCGDSTDTSTSTTGSGGGSGGTTPAATTGSQGTGGAGTGGNASTTAATGTGGSASSTSATGTGGGTSNGDFSCEGQPLPTDAPDPIAVTGTATEEGISSSPANDAKITAILDSAMVSTTSDANGKYTLSLVTGGKPWNGYFHTTRDGDEDSYLYPPVPLFEAENLPILTIAPGTVSLLGTITGTSQDTSKGLVAVEVLDCQKNAIVGATVTSSAGGTIFYTNKSGIPDKTATSTSESGLAYILNVPVGNTDVDAQLSGHTFRKHTVVAYKGALTTSGIVP